MQSEVGEIKAIPPIVHIAQSESPHLGWGCLDPHSTGVACATCFTFGQFVRNWVVINPPRPF